MSASSVRSKAVPLVLGLLTITSVGMAAGTLNTAERVGAEGESPIVNPPRPQEFSLDGNAQDLNGGGDAGVEANTDGISLQFCVEFLASGIGTMLVVGGFIAVVLGLFYRFSFAAALLGGWTLLPPVALVYFLLTNCRTEGVVDHQGGSGGIPNIGQSPLAGVEVPMWAMGIVVGGVILGAFAMLYYTATEEETVRPETEDEEGEGPALDDFAAAAGRAADRIEKHNAAVDNAVYRAWLEMTDLLDVENRDSYSPTEFAEEAISLGMSEDDVGELTELFNEVRYAGRDAAPREERAVAVLRTIEDAYGVEEREGVGADGDGESLSEDDSDE